MAPAVFMAGPIQAAPGINEQMNFQGRLLTAEGATVPDGFYNIQFKIYKDGDGQSVGNTTGTPAGTLLWTESRLNANAQGVRVQNGFLSVQLGSITSLSSVDWNSDTLWLSMNVGGTGSGATPTWDGEMLPMKRLSAVPYALNSQQLGGLDWTEFLQLAPAAAQIDASTLSSLFINKTGTGNVLQLQIDGKDEFVITDGGKVGIGLSNPTEELHVAGSGHALFQADGSASRVFIDPNALDSSAVLTLETSGKDARLRISAQSGAVSPFVSFDTASGDDWSIGLDDEDSGKFKISRGVGFGANDYFTITPTGNVGIGKTNPAYALDVAGTAQVSTNVLTPSLDAIIQPVGDITRTNLVTDISPSRGPDTSPYLVPDVFTPGANTVIVAYTHIGESCNTDTAVASDITISGGGLTWVPIGGDFVSGGCGTGIRAFYALIDGSPPQDMQVTIDGNGQEMLQIQVVIDEHDNLDRSNPAVGAAFNGAQFGANDTFSIDTAATPATDDWKVGFVGMSHNPPPTGFDVASGWTELYRLDSGEETQAIYQTDSTSRTVSFDLTPDVGSFTATAYGGFILKHATASSAPLTIGGVNASSIAIGNSGVDITLPNITLQADGDIATIGDIIFEGGDAAVGTNSSAALHFETNSTTRVTVTADGNVGIGTANPSEKLEVAGNGFFSGGLQVTNGALSLNAVDFAGTSITYVGSAFAHQPTDVGVTSLTVDKPTGTSEDDVMVAALAINGDDAVTGVPAGWVEIRQDVEENGNAASVRTTLYYKVATASEPTSYSWTFGSGDAAATILTYRNVNITDPVGATSGGIGNSTSLLAPSLTAVADNAQLVYFGSQHHFDGTPASYTPPTGMTERSEASSPDMGVIGADESIAVTGSTGSRSATSSTSSRWVAQMISLQVATAGASYALLESALGYDLVLEAGGNEAIRLTTNGNVGFGTATPAEKLSVAGTGQFGGLYTESDELVDADGSASNAAGTADAIAENDGLVAAQAADSICTDSLAAPANVFVDPSGTCDVDDGELGTPILLGSLPAGDGTTAADATLVDGSWAFLDNGATAGAYDDGEDLYTDSFMPLAYNSGRIGIGTASPGYTLDVQTANAIAARFSGRVIGATAVNPNEFVTLAQINSSGTNAFVLDGNSFGELATIGTTDPYSLEFITDSVVRATLDTNGNLYLGNGIAVANPVGGSLLATGSTAEGVSGATLTLQGGAGATSGLGSSGGDLLLQGGSAGGAGNNDGGDVILFAGTASGSGTAGSVLVKTDANSTTLFQVQDALGNGVLTVDTVNSTLELGAPNAMTGGLVFYNASGSGSFTLEAPDPGGNTYNISFPALSGTLCLTSGNCAGLGGNGDILQGGNNFSTDVTIGANDDHGLQLETNNTTRVNITNTGNVGIGLGLTAPSALLHVGATGGSPGSLISTPANDGNIGPVGDAAFGFFAQSFIAQSSKINSFGVSFEERTSEGEVRLAIVPDDGSGNPDEDNPLYTGPAIDPNNTTQWYYEQDLDITVTPGLTYYVLIDGYQNPGTSGEAEIAQSTQQPNSGENFVYSSAGNSWTTYNNPLAIYVEDTFQHAASAIFDGAIGIGTTTPNTELEVAGGVCVDDPGTTAECAPVVDGDIVAEGNITADQFIPGGFDVAETFNGDPGALTPGTLVAYGKTAGSVIATNEPYDTGALGIVSTDPGLKLTDLRGNRNDDIPVALAGRVPTKVSTENGVIEPGDMIAASSITGVGMKATEPGRVVGMALEGYSGEGAGKITVFVNPHTWIATLSSESLQGIPLDAKGGNSTSLAVGGVAASPDTTGPTSLQNSSTSSQDIQGNEASFKSLNVSGLAAVGELAVTGDARIDGDLTVAGAVTTGELTVKGLVKKDGDTKLTADVNTRQATIKEFVASKEIKPGSVVVLDSDHAGQVTTTKTAADTRIIGVAVTEAKEKGDKIDVAISGSVQARVPASKDLSEEEIVIPGKLLVASANEGLAQASTAPPVGSVLGKATSKPNEDNLVWVLITLN